ncbi:MAG: hypothetical protein FWG75_07205 [Cystobacterineae bacterium]|nr:hypothetical protein [Cystobacterineae bacterium]
MDFGSIGSMIGNVGSMISGIMGGGSSGSTSSITNMLGGIVDMFGGSGGGGGGGSISKMSGPSAQDFQGMLDKMMSKGMDNMMMQAQMQDIQETIAMMTNMLKKQNEIAMSVINNMR